MLIKFGVIYMTLTILRIKLKETLKKKNTVESNQMVTEQT